MKKIHSLREAVAYYLQCRRRLGFSLRQEGALLASLVDYAQQTHHRGALTTSLALAWAQLPPQASPLWWASRLGMIRRFARFWAAYDSRTEVPPRGVFGPTSRRGPVHIYTQKEIRVLLGATQQLGGESGCRSRLYRTLLGLLACTGLRISEALALGDQDVDWPSGVLTVRRAKGGQSRCLPLQASAVSALRAYRQWRQGAMVQPKSSAFFLTSKGRPPSYGQVAKVFRKLCSDSGWIHDPRPRLHDLRHTFAVNCLIRWHQKNREVGQKILALSTYLGHRQVSDTYWYLTAVPQLLNLSSKRFEKGDSRL